MFWVRQIDLNETELHVSGSVIVPIAIICRTDRINTGIGHTSIQIVNVLQLGSDEGKQKLKQKSSRKTLNNLPNSCLTIAPQRDCNAGVQIRC